MPKLTVEAVGTFDAPEGKQVSRVSRTNLEPMTAADLKPLTVLPEQAPVQTTEPCTPSKSCLGVHGSRIPHGLIHYCRTVFGGCTSEGGGATGQISGLT